MTTILIIAYILSGLISAIVFRRKLGLDSWEADDCIVALLFILLWPLEIIGCLLYLFGKGLIIAAKTFPWRRK